jgi:hypothetical protein
VAVLCLLALNLVRSRGGWLVDAAAAATFAVASLTLESGLLVWVIVVTAYAFGMRGVSRGGLLVMTGMLLGYLWVRFALLSVGAPGFNERSTGFLLSMLDPAAVQQRFGTNPLLFYAYNVGTSFLSVLFSEPDGGVFEAVRTWMRGDVPPRIYLAVISSCLSTVMIVWVIIAKLRGGLASFRDEDGQLLAVCAAVLAGNSAMSYVYTKHEILSVAGCFYAVAAFVAGRHVLRRLERLAPGALRLAIVMLVASTAVLWAIRSVGVHHMLRVQAFKVRSDWARLVGANEGASQDPATIALIEDLRADAVRRPVANPYLVPHWYDRWLGE